MLNARDKRLAPQARERIRGVIVHDTARTVEPTDARRSLHAPNMTGTAANDLGPMREGDGLPRFRGDRWQEVGKREIEDDVDALRLRELTVARLASLRVPGAALVARGAPCRVTDGSTAPRPSASMRLLQCVIGQAAGNRKTCAISRKMRRTAQAAGAAGLPDHPSEAAP